MAAVAEAALTLCHFDPETGADLEADKPKEDRCEHACYRCLLSYGNQPDHELLNHRHEVKDFLLYLSKSATQAGEEGMSYEERYHFLRGMTDGRSDLEMKVLDYLFRTSRKLPNHAQKNLSDYYACPDFFYDDTKAAVFCNGTVHDTPEQQEKDEALYQDLRDRGYRVVVIRLDEDLETQCKR